MSDDLQQPDPRDSAGTSPLPDEMKAYLQVYLDESEEELEALVTALLTLEDNPRDAEALNEAFRLLHTLKGSSGMMGFENVSEIAHELENRFETFRTGGQLLSQATMNVLLEAVDYFRAFNAALRREELLNDDGRYLIVRLEKLVVEPSPNDSAAEIALAADDDLVNRSTKTLALHGACRVNVRFEAGLQLADLKARLIVARLSQIGEIVATDPPIDDLQSMDDLPQFAVVVMSDQPLGEIRAIADVDGVAAVEILGESLVESLRQEADGRPLSGVPEMAESFDAAPSPEHTPAETAAEMRLAASTSDSETTDSLTTAAEPTKPEPPAPAPPAPVASKIEATDTTQPGEAHPAARAVSDPSDDAAVTLQVASRPKVNQTVRVDIDRLDRLMNLTGELVVTRARFTQITAEMSPVLRNRGVVNRSRDLGDRLRLALQKLHEAGTEQHDESDAWSHILNGLQEELTALDEQSAAWDEARKSFTRIAEAVDQLNRVSDNLQHGVLETRMVQVAPLFNRFRRVVRDLCAERHKLVQLLIEGENTELDKRMIDELGDPLIHLVRNSIDHGLEPPEERSRLGKPEVGSICLAASHSGNNVLIRVRDDGAGLNVERIRQRLLDRGLVTKEQLSELSEQQVIDYIWKAGFSTAESVTDISGRGVGMDVVRKRILELNGTIEVESKPGEGSTFTIRLPLTLAIIHSLLVRFGDGVFSIPIDDVREIVAVPGSEVYAVHGFRTIDVRGEFIPVARMEDVFEWNSGSSPDTTNVRSPAETETSKPINIVILDNGDRPFGLCVDELLGGTDIVIKSLADNYCNIRGLSGASVMGDGSVCLMLDVNAMTELAAERARSVTIPGTVSG